MMKSSCLLAMHCNGLHEHIVASSGAKWIYGSSSQLLQKSCFAQSVSSQCVSSECLQNSGCVAIVASCLSYTTICFEKMTKDFPFQDVRLLSSVQSDCFCMIHQILSLVWYDASCCCFAKGFIFLISNVTLHCTFERSFDLIDQFPCCSRSLSLIVCGWYSRFWTRLSSMMQAIAKPIFFLILNCPFKASEKLFPFPHFLLWCNLHIAPPRISFWQLLSSLDRIWLVCFQLVHSHCLVVSIARCSNRTRLLSRIQSSPVRPSNPIQSTYSFWTVKTVQNRSRQVRIG